MPGLTIQTTDPAAAAAAATSRRGANPAQPRTSSPTRPPVSPITPTLEPAQLPGTTTTTATTATTTTTNNNPIPDFAHGRPVFTHSQPDQVGIAPPPPVPIAFDDNPDVLALKSAISILQLQRARATADMQALGRAKAAALADPGAFVADLTAGRVGVEGDPLMFSGADISDDSESESDSEDGVKEESSSDIISKTSPARRGRGKDAATTTQVSRTSKKRKGKRKDGMAGAQPWGKLPKPQTVVRCPPINWAQYGVMGESLDKLHAEQIAAPTPGMPIVLGTGSSYEFKAGEQASGEPGRRLVGIAAPYTPGKDKIEKKTKGKR